MEFLKISDDKYSFLILEKIKLRMSCHSQNHVTSY